ncbi:MAG: rRNA maturation RNase YbeY [Candidatus Pacebacteria bacterium]|nr:rRNA maturation RNase YbeY [Candidatus Paceibacterota bacterium]
MVEINNLTLAKIDKNLLKKSAEIVLKEEGKKDSDLSIVIAGEKRIRFLNKKYRKKDKPTDVLSFSFNQGNLKEGLGEIVICLKIVEKNSKRFKLNYKEEAARVLIHGILHLLGYKHEGSNKERQIMNKKEEYYLNYAKAL